MSDYNWITSFNNIDRVTSWSTSGSAGDSPAFNSADGSSESILFFHSDRQFKVRGITNLSGNIVEIYNYTPSGKQPIEESYLWFSVLATSTTNLVVL